MEQKYQMDLTVGYSETDKRLIMTPAALLHGLQELAIRHSNAIGFTLDYLEEKRWGWVVTNWHILLLAPCHYGEQVRFLTWADSCKRLLAQRSFLVQTQKGETACKAVSRWILMDLEKRQPIPVPAFMQEAYRCALPPAIAKQRYVIKKGIARQLFQQKVFQITREDTDTNGHVNNIKYVEWAMGLAPVHFYNDYRAADIQAAYRKECYASRYLLAQCFWIQEEDSISVRFLDAADGKTVYSEVFIVWQQSEKEER